MLLSLALHAYATQVCVQPLEPFRAELTAPVERGVTQLYGFDVRTLPARPLPPLAWYPARERWRADKLLDWLDDEVTSDCDIVVGFTAADISTTKPPYEDWGVFGLGEIGGRTSMVSTFRLRDQGGEKSRLRRTVKVVNHEIGHVLGVPHVQGAGCLMHDAEGSIRTVDTETGLLCPSTHAWIEQHRGVELPDLQIMDWAAVEP